MFLTVYVSSYSERDGEGDIERLIDTLGVILCEDDGLREDEGERLILADGDGLIDRLKEAPSCKTIFPESSWST